MNLKRTIINSLLIAVGFILHQITPPLLLGMKPDFSLAMLFIIILLNDDYKTALTTGIVCGILSAVTTGFPGGQIPNVIDKFITANCIYFLTKILSKKLTSQIKIIILTVTGTLISGLVFLISASVLVGLPGSLFTLYVGIVLPATLINTFAAAIIFNAIKVSFKYSNVKVFNDINASK
ncbi:tryptophan transporter [Clostridium ganghwense]|uniref:Tryptophan transporter n=1 Tax=Clostridium ganghwense TaxID=312089 RepID=A0ABT4CS87_9CLOT|nr:tryptophan transporter [Clostridium ganghwense]MCY6371933.1 tryptophan transporter [Clostridium ganghwense]